MDKENERYAAYVSILKEELIPAMGCTEPIALAYAAANAAQVLGTALTGWWWMPAAASSKT